MFSKKLLALVCAAGILAFGGCIFIPSGSGPRPAAPSIDLRGVESIAVEVTNASEQHHMDSSVLARYVASDINARTGGAGVKAHVLTEATSGEAVLKITVLSETLSALPASASTSALRWRFQFKASATLAKRDGQIVWSREDVEYSRLEKYETKDPQDMWNDSVLQRGLVWGLGDTVVDRMLYSK